MQKTATLYTQPILRTAYMPMHDLSSENCTERSYLDAALWSEMVRGGAAMLRNHAQTVNQLNVFPVPDGDTGDNMCLTLESGVASLQSTSFTTLSEEMHALAHGMLLGARGNSGVILSQFFSGLANGMGQKATATVHDLAKALQSGVKQAYAAVLTPTEGTILTVVRESVSYAVERLSEHSTVESLFDDLLTEIHASLERTPDLLPILKEAGVIDSGGAGFLYIMQGFCAVLNGEAIVQEGKKVPAPASAPVPNLSAIGPDFEMQYGYCTETLLQLQNKKTAVNTFSLASLKDFLCRVGDSVVTFMEGTIVKIHVHTHTPEQVLAYCRQFGELLTVKIENMSLQHTNTLTPDVGNDAKDTVEPSAERKTVATVCVCSGSGIAEIFRSLGADAIISGGQTNNPSAQDFLDAFRRVNAEHVFVFPNNGNVLLAARQAAALYSGAVIHVMESRDIGSCYAALASRTPGDCNPVTVEQAMRDALGKTATGLLSPAVRDAAFDGIRICKGDYIGFVGKQMIVSERDKHDAALALAHALLTDTPRSVLTVFSGKDTTDAEAAALELQLQVKYPAAEFYFARGEQDVYPYLMIAE